MISFFRYSRIYSNQLSNNRRQLYACTLTIPIQSNVNHEVTRKLSLCIPLSGKFYSAHSKEKLLSAASRRLLTSQFYIRQNFSSSSGSDRLDDSRTLMVAGLSKDTTVAWLRECFRKKWEVTNCIIPRDKETGASLQYGFVELATFEQAKHALEFDHRIDGKQVNVKMSGTKELEDKYRIFVGGLLKETSGETLESYFSNYGDIFECHIVRMENNISKGFGYVTYKSQDSVDRALNSQPHCIDGKEVFVEHTAPRRRELTLFVGNLSRKTTDESLREHFSKYGQLTQSEVKIDRQTGQSRGFGYVGFKSQEADSKRSLPMISHCRHLRSHFHQIFNTRRQLCAFTLTVPIQSNVKHEVTRKVSVCTPLLLATSKPLSIENYSAHSEEKLLSAANRRHLTSQILRRNFSSKFNDPRQSERDARTLMVAGLSRDTTVAALDECFSKKWEVTDCRIARDKMTGASRKFGFVEFVTAEQAKHALEFDHFIDGKQVNVKMKGGKELEDKYRIFVGGLLKETSGETLENYFSNYGDIFECHIVRNEDNSSRGFGYVTYESQDSVDRALNSQPHCIDNQVLTVRQASLRRRELTLFIGNLSPQTNDESLRDHFSKYGQLTQCNVKIDRQTGQSRGFGYVAFASQEELDSALNDQHVIDGVKVKLGNSSSELDLMVDSLPQNISEESLDMKLWDYFSRYGRVRDCRFIKNSAGNTTAFVSMSSKDDISRALNGRPHRIDGKLVDTHQKGEQFSVYVTGLPKDTTDEVLCETFSKVGKPVHWQVMRAWKDKTNRPLGYAYVAFSSAEEVDQVMDARPYYIHGSELTVQRRLQRKKETIKN